MIPHPQYQQAQNSNSGLHARYVESEDTVPLTVIITWVSHFKGDICLKFGCNGPTFLTQQTESWLTDIGVTDHLTSNLSNLSLQHSCTGSELVSVGNGQTHPTTHVGNGKLRTNIYHFKLCNILCYTQRSQGVPSSHSYSTSPC